MSNGSFTVQGQQNNLAQGTVNIGPLVAQCSPYAEIFTIATAAGTYTVDPPSNAVGAMLICPNSGGPASIKWGPSTALQYVNPTGGFAIWQFDPNNFPSAIDVVTTGASTSNSAVLQIF